MAKEMMFHYRMYGLYGKAAEGYSVCMVSPRDLSIISFPSEEILAGLCRILSSKGKVATVSEGISTGRLVLHVPYGVAKKWRGVFLKILGQLV